MIQEDKNIQSIGLSKPLFTVHMSNDLTLLEKKVMNCLIKHIHNIESTVEKVGKYVTPQGNFYEFTFDKIEEWLELDKYHQRKDIVLALRKLMTTILEFNIFKRDNKKFKDVVLNVLLAGVKFRETFQQEKDTAEENIQNSKIYFAFSPFLVEAILTPIPYAKLAFKEQNQLNSKHSLALWEALNAELNGQGKDSCLTQVLSIEKYEDLVAGRESSYKDFKHINHELIKKPLKEINEKTSIKASVILYKEGRKTNGLQFDISKKNQTQKLDIDNEELRVVDKKSDVEVNRHAVKIELQKLISSEKVVNDILFKYKDDKYILTNLKNITNGSKTPSAALIRAALRDDYAGYNNNDLFSAIKPHEELSPQSEFNLIFPTEKIYEMERLNDFMDVFLPALKNNIDEQDFHYLFQDLKLYSANNNYLVFITPNIKIRDSIFLHFHNRLTKILQKTYLKYFNERLEDFIIIPTTDARLIPFRELVI